ncbi:MAG: hypothetical protein ACI93R_003129 [Flavobacteriales bacterium]|jgi:hypothetical protein
MKQVTLYGPGHGPSFFVDDKTAESLQEDFTKGKDLKILSVDESKVTLVKGSQCWAMQQSESSADEEVFYKSHISKVESVEK